MEIPLPSQPTVSGVLNSLGVVSHSESELLRLHVIPKFQDRFNVNVNVNLILQQKVELSKVQMNRSQEVYNYHMFINFNQTQNRCRIRFHVHIINKKKLKNPMKAKIQGSTKFHIHEKN